MSLPTRHWAILSGSLNAGASATVAHGLRTGQYPNGVVPNVMVDVVESSVGFARGSNFVSPYQTWDATNVYLSNWDGTQAHAYHYLIRSYHSMNGRNL